jgi:hypothetical protein
MSNPPITVTRVVDDRDERCCWMCGESMYITSGSRHHRQRRAVGGHRVSVLILLCGSGTTGCHGWVHANPNKARARGYIIPTWVHDPEEVPIQDGVTKEWFLLKDDGTKEPIIFAVAQELLAAFGMLRGVEL